LIVVTLELRDYIKFGWFSVNMKMLEFVPVDYVRFARWQVAGSRWQDLENLRFFCLYSKKINFFLNLI